MPDFFACVCPPPLLSQRNMQVSQVIMNATSECCSFLSSCLCLLCFLRYILLIFWLGLNLCLVCSGESYSEPCVKSKVGSVFIKRSYSHPALKSNFVKFKCDKTTMPFRGIQLRFLWHSSYSPNALASRFISFNL